MEENIETKFSDSFITKNCKQNFESSVSVFLRNTPSLDIYGIKLK